MSRRTSGELSLELREVSEKREKALSWLNHVRGLNARVKSLQDEIAFQRDMLDGVESVGFGERVSVGSVYKDSIPDAISRLEGLVEEYCKELTVCIDEQRKAHSILRKLESNRQISILTKRFLLGEKCSEVALSLGYKTSEVAMIERAGLEAVYEIMPRYWREKEAPSASDIMGMYWDYRIESMIY